MRTPSSVLCTLSAVFLLGAGCSSVKQISPAVVRQGAATIVGYAAVKYPQAMPEVKLAGEVICSAANSTNLNPSAVVADINKITTLSPEAVLIVNSALTLYIGVWSSYGTAAVNNSPALQSYLEATCMGINDGLGANGLRRTADKTAWPVVHFK